MQHSPVCKTHALLHNIRKPHKARAFTYRRTTLKRYCAAMKASRMLWLVSYKLENATLITYENVLKFNDFLLFNGQKKQCGIFKRVYLEIAFSRKIKHSSVRNVSDEMCHTTFNNFQNVYFYSEFNPSDKTLFTFKSPFQKSVFQNHEVAYIEIGNTYTYNEG